MRRAMLEFGGIDRAKEECRDLHVWSWVERVWLDLCYGARLLLRSPGFTFIAVISLALGIGANTAIFSVVDALMFRALPVHNPEELVTLKWVGGNTPYYDIDSAEFTTYRDQAPAFSGMAGSEIIDRDSVRISGAGRELDSSTVHVNLVSGNYFSVLGISAAIGNALTTADDVPGAHPVAAISYDYWRRRFARLREDERRRDRADESTRRVHGS